MDRTGTLGYTTSRSLIRVPAAMVYKETRTRVSIEQLCSAVCNTHCQARTVVAKVIHGSKLILAVSLASGNSAEFGEITKHSKNDVMFFFTNRCEAVVIAVTGIIEVWV